MLHLLGLALCLIKLFDTELAVTLPVSAGGRFGNNFLLRISCKVYRLYLYLSFLEVEENETPS